MLWDLQGQLSTAGRSVEKRPPLSHHKRRPLASLPSAGSGQGQQSAVPRAARVVIYEYMPNNWNYTRPVYT